MKTTHCYASGQVLAVIAAVALLTGCADEAPLEPQANVSGVTDLDAAMPSAPGAARLLVEGLEFASGSTVGPGGALFVTEGGAGRISSIDPGTGNVTTLATGLPPSILGVGGANDVAFLGGDAYALVTLVGSDVGGSDVVGIYRMEGPDTFTVIADIGSYNLANPPSTAFFIPTGMQYSFVAWRGAFLVADGHHNRVLHVTTDGDITEFRTFGNVVPTGLATSGNTVFMAEAGPIPHLPNDGRVISFTPASPTVTDLASGGRLLVDVELGRGRTVFALSQGVWDQVAEGSPALPNTGSLLRVGDDGTFTVVADGLDRPTSLEIIGNTAYVFTLAGEVWTIDNIAGPPFGR